jgi:superfamily II DNA helicase RecQ
MRVKFFAVPALDPGGAEAAVNAFVTQHRVTSMDRQLVSEGSGSFWALCVTYVDGAPGAASSAKRGKVDYREVLSPEDFEVYAELRRLRKELAERDGVPLYAIFTNEQMAAMVRQRLRTRQELGALAGVGPSKTAKYGPAFLERLAAAQAAAADSEVGDAPDGDPPR